MVGLCGLEPQTSSLSVTRSNQLSYNPLAHGILQIKSLQIGIFPNEARLLIERVRKNAKMNDFSAKFGGVTGIQTLDLRLAKAAL